MQCVSVLTADRMIEGLGGRGSDGEIDSTHKEHVVCNPILIIMLAPGLVGCLFGFKRPFEAVFQSTSGRLPEREGDGREKDGPWSSALRNHGRTPVHRPSRAA